MRLAPAKVALLSVMNSKGLTSISKAFCSRHEKGELDVRRGGIVLSTEKYKDGSNRVSISSQLY
jgi:hypothetical protein